MGVAIQIRGGTAAAWTLANPTLKIREMGVEIDTLGLKIGDGATAWNGLAYAVLHTQYIKHSLGTAIGDLLTAPSVGVFAALPDVAVNNVLLSGGVGAVPAYGKVGLTTHVDGILGSANGGTGNGFTKFSGPATAEKTFTLPDASATLLYDGKASGTFGVASTATGSVVLYNVGNANAFTLQPGATGAALSWTLPITAPAGNNYLVNIQTTGVLGYTDPATLSPVAGSASIVTVGAITTGSWHGTAVAADHGGTGQTVYAVGDLIQANTTITLAKLPAVAVGNALISGGIGVISIWGKIGLTTHVSGILGSANGGTGNGFAKFSGPTISEKTFTLPDASTTILTGNLITAAYDFIVGTSSGVAAKKTLAETKTILGLGVGTYTPGATTVDITGVRFMSIANSSPTTITTFTGGVTGQTITFSFSDANTTINRSMAYFAGGVSFVSVFLATLTVVFIINGIFEVSRTMDNA